MADTGMALCSYGVLPRGSTAEDVEEGEEKVAHGEALL